MTPSLISSCNKFEHFCVVWNKNKFIHFFWCIFLRLWFNSYFVRIISFEICKDKIKPRKDLGPFYLEHFFVYMNTPSWYTESFRFLAKAKLGPLEFSLLFEIIFICEVVFIFYVSSFLRSSSFLWSLSSFLGCLHFSGCLHYSGPLHFWGHIHFWSCLHFWGHLHHSVALDKVNLPYSTLVHATHRF